ncbi:MAG: DNA mismatch repair endonuclease MutL [Phycisphaerales bacterium]
MHAATDATARRPIRALPDLLVNQIAAGEVVERPASVVKELVENAIDAGASRVTVELESGGIELIRVSDDGRGIPAAELPLALAPHATSKIERADDLDQIGTLGFRGEALASIASVARVTIRSRTAEQDGAAEVHAEGAEAGPVQPAAGPVGTSVTVRNLFFNTPARRKFLRTPQTEQGRSLDAVRDLAMAHPAVAFTARVDGRVVLDLPPGQSARERALAILGPELGPQLLEASADSFDDARGLALWGLVGLPAIARATNQAQHVFLNGRCIRDKTVQHAIKEAYRGLIEPGRHPTAVLMLEMNPGAVDVNVHPAKVEVRFRDPSLVHSAVLRAVRDALRGADLTPTAGQASRGFEARAILPASASPGGPAGGAGPGEGVTGATASRFGGFVDYFRREVPERAQGDISYEAIRAAASGPAPPAPIEPAMTGPHAAPEEGSSAGGASMPVALPAQRILQVHNSYLVTQDEHGVVIVDQHALHERVMFEQLMARIREAPLESQRLLTPAVVPASERQLEKLAEFAPLLARIGVEAEAIGPRALAVHAFPTFLFSRGVDPVELLTELFERAEADGFAPGSEAALHEVLDMMACKAAVKAGDRLSEGELAELLRLREEVDRSSNCPHGRPTTVRLTIRELEKLFKRT